MCSLGDATISFVGWGGEARNIILLTLTRILLRKKQQIAIHLIKLFQTNKIKSRFANLKSHIFFPLNMIISMSGSN